MRLISISNGGTSVGVCVNLCSVVSSSAPLAPTLSLSLPFFPPLYPPEVRTRSLSLIMPCFHHTLADIFETWILSFCPEKNAATLHFVQQQRYGIPPGPLPTPLPHVSYSSVFVSSDGATLVDPHTRHIRISNAVSAHLGF